MDYDNEFSEGWDCDPNAHLADDSDYRDEEDSTGDWQEICLDRWGDRQCWRAAS